MSMSDPVRWLLANAELDWVLEQSPDERAADLASLRARDAALATDVESLLEEHPALDAAGFLTDAPAGEAMQTSDVAMPWALRPAWAAPHWRRARSSDRIGSCAPGVPQHTAMSMTRQLTPEVFDNIISETDQQQAGANLGVT